MKDDLNLLMEQNEHEGLDFKRELYSKTKYEDLLKDVLGMANSRYKGSKYIVFGVKENVNQTKDIIGIKEPIDAAIYQQIISENIEPDINLELKYVNFDDKLLAVLQINDSVDKPYLLKKQYGNLHKGFCYVRKGSKNEHAVRTDFDFYYKQGNFEIHVIEKYLMAVDDKNGYAHIECAFRNCSEFPISIRYAELEIWHKDQVKSIHPLFGFTKNPVGADFRLSLPAKHEVIDYFAFGFTSTDCLRLEMDEYGHTQIPLKCRLVVLDSLKNEYFSELEECLVLAKGEFLWKVKLANK